MTDINAIVREEWQEALSKGEHLLLSDIADRILTTRADDMQTHADYLCRSPS